MSSSSEKPKFNLKLNLVKIQEKRSYTNFKIRNSEKMGFLDVQGRKVGMPVIHSFQSNQSGSAKVSELVEHTRWPTIGFPRAEQYASQPKYMLSTMAKESSPNTFTFRDEHFTPLEYFQTAMEQPKKAPERRNLPGLSGGHRGDRKPMVFESQQLWMSPEGEVIPNSGFSIKKHIWYEGAHQDKASGEQFNVFKMRVSKRPSSVNIDYMDRSNVTGPGGRHRSTHHVFVALGPDSQYHSAKTRKGLMAKLAGTPED